MSIINNVLKDLESRPSRFTPIEIAVAGPGPSERNTMKGLLLVILPLSMLLVAAVFHYQLVYEVKQNPTVSLDAATSEKSVLAVTPSPPEVEPVQNHISSLQIRESASEVSLEFSLQERAVSYLKERSDNLFIYHLKNVRSEIEAPRINNNRWIESLQIHPSQQGIDVVLKTASTVLVKTAQTQQQDESLWTIRLEKQPDPPAMARPEPVATEPANKPEAVAENQKSVDAIDVVKAEKAPVKVEIKTVDQSQSASVKLTRASELIRDRQWQQAEPLLRSLIGGSLDISARRQLLILYNRSGDSDSYLDFARQAYEQYPEQSVFKTELARALFQQQRYSEAVDVLQNAGDLDATQHSLLAAAYQRTNRHPQAVEHYHHALRLDQGNSRNWIGLGISLEHEGNLEKALQSYNTALRLGNLSARLTEFVKQRAQVIAKAAN